MASSAPEKLARAVVVGGTHGNEFTGAYLVRHWAAHPAEIQRAELEVGCVLSNPRAFDEVRRYVDQDLNRCFTEQTLAEGQGYEPDRARALRAEVFAGQPPDEVFVLDLHTTTAGMGKSLILGSLTPFNAALTAWVCAEDPEVKAYGWVEGGKNPGFISGTGACGLAVEVGPIANGVLDAMIFQQTRELTNLCLDFAARWNELADEGTSPLAAFGDLSLELYEHQEHVDYPRDDEGRPTAMVHPALQDRDFEPLEPGDPLFVTFGGETVPYAGPAGRAPVFINEAAYYEKGIALTLTEKSSRQVAEFFQ